VRSKNFLRSTSVLPCFGGVRTLCAVVLTLVLASCGDDDLTTPTNPTPTPPVTETFSGTVNQNGATTHNFSTQSSGTVTATLSTLAPDSAAVIGLSLGTWNASTSSCQLVITNDRATQGSVVSGGVSSFGSLCVRVYDVGSITAAQPFAYEITVVHP
jgi:hypothetical protein